MKNNKYVKKALFFYIAPLYQEAGIHLLDGTVVTIDTITFGGAMGWYDGKYAKHHNIHLGKHPRECYRRYHDLQELWLDSMPDDDIKPMIRFDGLLKEELAKIDDIVERCDVMITHINPSIQQEYQHPKWRDNPSCGFYSFDGKEYTDRFNGSHWIFGHSHFCGLNKVDREEKVPFDLVVNALGYPQGNPRNYPKIVTIEIEGNAKL